MSRRILTILVFLGPFQLIYANHTHQYPHEGCPTDFRLFEQAILNSLIERATTRAQLAMDQSNPILALRRTHGSFLDVVNYLHTLNLTVGQHATLTGFAQGIAEGTSLLSLLFRMRSLLLVVRQHYTGQRDLAEILNTWRTQMGNLMNLQEQEALRTMNQTDIDRVERLWIFVQEPDMNNVFRMRVQRVREQLQKQALRGGISLSFSSSD